MTTNSKLLSVTFATASLLMVPGFAQEQNEKADSIIGTKQRLGTEVNRQNGVGRKMNSVVRRLSFLLEDLQSNGLGEEGNATTLGETRNALGGLRTQKIVAARDELSNAREKFQPGNPEVAHPHLTEAGKTIEEIVEELDKIISGANTVLVDDLLIKQIREIIKTEEFMQRQTKQWGIEAYTNKEAAKVDQARLGRAQQAVIDRYGQFFQTLVKARKEAVDEETLSKFGRAELSLLESKPVAHMARAIEQIAQTKAADAVTDQEKALEALREVEKILAAESSGMSDLVADIAQILADQKDLQQDTVQADGEVFKSEQSQLEARQLEIGIQIEEVAAEHLVEETTPDAEDPLRDALTEAEEHVSVAAAEINTGNKDGGIKAQSDVIAALEKALAAAEAGAEAELGSGDGLSDDGFGDDG
ncbi:MAG TPA: hypothetical protein DCQ96_02995, partial [Verrucomicrobiales bacterium]|nr:hypothetical protein [Verrucomicrobiales bacterium]